MTCGEDANANCCASSLVPGNAANAMMAGASFFRSHDVAADGSYADQSFPATLSDFCLDTYEVTVGRFRAFVAAGMGTQASPPAPGDGAHAALRDSGWSAGDDRHPVRTPHPP